MRKPYEHTREWIKVANVLEDVMVSRPTLYTKFRVVLGCNVFHEIRRMQIGQTPTTYRNQFRQT